MGFGSLGWRGGGVRTAPFAQTSAGAWLVPTAGSRFVACHEVLKSVYNTAATALGISATVQAIAWHQATLGKDRLFIPQSLATSVISNVAYCELGNDPVVIVNFDNAQTYCWNMGTGWHLMTQAQWHVVGVISHYYWVNGQGKTNVTGNTQHGRSHSVTSEIGIRSDGLAVTGANQGTYGRTLTGQKRLADGGGLLLQWAHNGTANGIFDLVGNVWEWCSRLRVVDWEIQIIPASSGVQADHGVASAAWRGILSDGSLVAPGTAGTLKYSTDSGIYLSTTQAGTGATVLFKDIGAGAISPVPPILVALGLYPWSASVPTAGTVFATASGERLPLRGGAWNNGSSAGVAALPLINGRTYAAIDLGFRPAFVL